MYSAPILRIIFAQILLVGWLGQLIDFVPSGSSLAKAADAAPVFDQENPSTPGQPLQNELDEPALCAGIGLKRICPLPHTSQPHHYWRQRVQFVNERCGWVRTHEGLWRTSDGGTSWEHVFTTKVNAGSEHTFGFFQFLDTNVGWALIDDELCRTIDGGSTWSRSTQMSGCIAVYGFAFDADGTHGWAAGVTERRLRKNEGLPNRFTLAVNKDGGGTGIFPVAFVTPDGGKPWRRQTMPRVPGDIYYVCLANEEHAWAIGQAGFFRMTDGKWQTSKSVTYDDEGRPRVAGLKVAIGIPTYAPVNLYFLTDQLGWLVNSNGALAVTHDGSHQWEDLVTRDGDLGPALFGEFFCGGLLYRPAQRLCDRRLGRPLRFWRRWEVLVVRRCGGRAERLFLPHTWTGLGSQRDGSVQARATIDRNRAPRILTSQAPLLCVREAKSLTPPSRIFISACRSNAQVSCNEELSHAASEASNERVDNHIGT